jgi:signal transduction histidine kinase/CheY-like chemotaxis protein
LCVPVISPYRVWGWLGLGDKIGAVEFSEEDEGLAQILAAQLGRIYENGSLYAEVRRQFVELEHIYATVPIGLALVDRELRYSRVNEFLANIHGLSAAGHIGKTALDVIPSLGAAICASQRQVLLTGQPLLNVQMHAAMLAGPNAERDWLVNYYPFRSDHGAIHGVGLVVLDITESKRLEEQFRQAQKMESVGQLAGGVAHDFNNMLTVMQGYASLIAGFEGLPPEVMEATREISLAADRAANLTRQLLTFSRRQVMQPQDLDLNHQVEAMTKMLQRILGEHIAIAFEPSADLPLVRADAGMMDQIILNLAVNSRDAMPKGGRLTIRTGSRVIDEASARRHPGVTPGPFVFLSVTDTGCGISPENLKRIFEPFFTTKEVGKGTGLGLATVYGVVRQHRGGIEVLSQVGRGTTFEVLLPALNQEAAFPAFCQPAPAKLRGGTEAILLVEDDNSLRLMVRRVLAQTGYRVFDVPSGVEALALWEQQRGKIDLLLTDMVMPDGLTGGELAERLQRENRNFKVIFTSGYSTEINRRDVVLRDGINFLQKPYKPGRLLEVVRACLDADLADSVRQPSI